uniref:monodehydroascorbate reductase (NADH) n=1 Tax=Chromera velia CCMP2878 TaxID=1169474 RepID=A0A0G4H811_9ALVE|eukprot:Cvel_25034.t1-p1 / transcript=Cvel_25034.t1 / gene=Cvel_25034 / organism=Chromera_velia_CCMP2878 / gene_product=Monodehydroascorbate reductase, seedling isozyme, putative / transcript_product=Monodehydroascorbate reductase, seedling isozyme, putative / location=Cvel_scaffold2779:99-5108(+) / protein_length=227 / sequence_SO=supercontig / SO=protein_coding / is_pseudo=false
MERLFTPELATFYEEFYSKKGATIMKGRLVKALKPGADGSRAEVAVLDDGSEVKGDLFVGGTGAKPNGELFAGQLETDRGAVKVDGFMQSSVKNVLAIGDVAAFPLKRWQQHVTHCRLSAAHAASVILEGPEKTGEYDYLPFFYSRVFNLSWQFYGVNEGTPVFFSHSQDPSAPKFGSFWVKDGKIVGTFLEGGAPEENTACKNAVAEGKAAPSADTIAKDGIKSIA